MFLQELRVRVLFLILRDSMMVHHILNVGALIEQSLSDHDFVCEGPLFAYWWHVMAAECRPEIYTLVSDGV